MKKLTLCIGLLCGLSLVSESYGQSNITLGNNVLSNNTTGNYNVGIGDGALYDNTTGKSNTAIGYSSLTNNITGNENVAVGNLSLHQNETGYDNVAVGNSSLYQNETGYDNTAIGSSALMFNLWGYANVGVGKNSLYHNGGNYNTGIGNQSLYNNVSGDYNTSVGINSLYSNTFGDYNTANGGNAMEKNTTGSYNTALGYTALTNNTTGQRNTAIGMAAVRQNTSGQNLTAIGYDALRYNTTGTGNTALGYRAMGTSAASAYSYSVALGAYSLPTASYQVRVGYFGTSSIGGSQNWTNLSDGRFKKEVKEDVLGLDFIKQLRPVSYYVDNKAVNEFLGVDLEEAAINNKKQYQTGFIAQEVEATAKELGFEHFGGVDAPENEESHYGLRYAEFVVPLVKSVQELSAQNEELKALIATQQTQINDLLEAKNTSLNTRSTTSTQSQAQLHQNIPNPFTNETQINLFVPQEVGQALIQVCTIDGKQLFVKEVEGRNETSVVIEGNNLAAGIYMYTLIVDNEIITSKRMVLTK